MEDLVLGTVGVVMLLLVLALAQIGVPDVSKDKLEALRVAMTLAQQERSAAQRRAAVAETTAAQARAARALAEEELELERRRREGAEQARAQAEAARGRAEDDARHLKGELSPKPVSVVVVCDGTLSMQPVLLALQKAILSLAEIGSRLSPRFELGLVVYRGKGYQHTLPLTVVGRTAGGRQSSGMAGLRHFMEAKDLRIEIFNFPSGSEVGTPTGRFDLCSRMSPLSGFAHAEDGVREGIAMLSQKPEGTRSVLILVGDVGTHELGDPNKLDAPDEASAARIQEMVRGFTRSHARGRVWSVFAGKDTGRQQFPTQSAAFFQSVAAAAGTRGSYSDDLSSLTAATVEAVFKPNGAQR